MPRSTINVCAVAVWWFLTAGAATGGTMLFSDPGQYTVEATFFEYSLHAYSNVRVGQDFDDSRDAYTDLPFGPIQHEFITNAARPGIASQSYARGAYDANVLDRRISYLGHAFTEVLTSPASGDASGSALFNLSMDFTLSIDGGAGISFVNAFLRMRSHVGNVGNSGNISTEASIVGPGLDMSLSPDEDETLMIDEIVQLVAGDYSIYVSGSVDANELQEGMSASLHSIAYFLLDFDETSPYTIPGPDEPEEFPPPPPLPPLPAPGPVVLLAIAAATHARRRRM